MTEKPNFQRYISVLLIGILIGFFLAWVFNVINPNSPSEIIEKPALISESQSISGIAIPVDGDSIKIEKNSIRLLGIDAPEFKQKCLDKNSYEYNCGEISSQFLSKLIKGKNIICYYQEQDIYKRFLGICYLDKININQEILKNGMAIIYDPSQADSELKQIEAKAKELKIGIWQGAFLDPKEYRKKNKNKKTNAKQN